ncbi:diacylglycerol O-acyltransferase 2 isoform X3 [Heterodontus francisci]|uniref:diacylglycerol O-acyltransferase 2 isoform X3 n=1 Tax=Heterodontus francisci TaxID=7792 RepID=UPI00355C3920
MQYLTGRLESLRKTVVIAIHRNIHELWRTTAGTGASILSALSHLSSLPWLARSKIERHLQMISVYQWVITFLIMGGRRSEWVRNWAVWRYFREYFPIRLVKTHNLDPTRNYIFGCHPHGIFSFGAFCNFGTEATGFSNKFPGIRPFLATLAGNFRMPILREYLMSGGIFPVTREAIDFLLSKSGTGNAVIIVIGGSAESLNCSPGSNVVTLKNRKGFVKMALQNGADLVPVYTFGENDVYRQIVFKEGSLMRVIQRKFQKLIGFAPCVFQGRGFFSSNSWGLVPYAKPINTVVGEPITVPQIENPSQEEVDIYHKMYICSLGKLFNKYKTKFGYCETDRLKVI